MKQILADIIAATLVVTVFAFLAGIAGMGAEQYYAPQKERIRKMEESNAVYRINHTWCLDKKHYCGGRK